MGVFRHGLIGLLWLMLLHPVAQGADTAGPVDFVRDVRPIFERHCYRCHGPATAKSGLRLDLKQRAIKGGDYYAPNIIPGNAAESPLIQFVSEDGGDSPMPPEGERLSPQDVEILTRWVNAGAVWPDGIDATTAAEERPHWAFQPIRNPFAGEKRLNADGHPIDVLIGRSLRKAGLTRNPPADRRTLIRRLTLVLHGLPPTPDEVAQFETDDSPDAYQRLVDRLLASPRYGERWASHWLDTIAFAETHGFEVNTPRDNAWPYRDYVIDALNRDTPYPQFILEQLAGDAVGVDAATGFLVAAAVLLPGQIGKDEESQKKARQDQLHDMVAVTGGAFLGLTLHCARCHDHKFDPVTQADYYGLQAVFSGVHHGERPVLNGRNPAGDRERLEQATHRLISFEPSAGQGTVAPSELRGPVHAKRNVDRFTPVVAGKLRFTIQATDSNNHREPYLDEFEVYSTDGRNVASAARQARAIASDGARLERLNDDLYGNEFSWASKTKGTGWVEIEFARPETIEAVVWGRDRFGRYADRLAVRYQIDVTAPDGTVQTVASSADREDYAESAKEILPPNRLSGTDLEAWRKADRELQSLTAAGGPQLVYAGRFQPAAASYRLHRGEVLQPKEQVPPSAVRSLSPPLELPEEMPEQQRRIALARWLADAANPLPARVMVNRLWQHHFGEGLVLTANDFGRNGSAPTHPELLDWLAGEFLRSGGSLKQMHRLILTSETWRQSSRPRPEGLQADAQSRLLWRYPPRRLDAEVLRDSMLAASGALDLTMGGPGFSVFEPNDNYVRVYRPKKNYGPAEWRRMIYGTKVRMEQDATFGAFDCPDAGQPQPTRGRSTTPLQSLNLLNSVFVIQQAEVFSERILREAGPRQRDQIRLAFRLIFQRLPDDIEQQWAIDLAREHGLTAVCRAMFNANEFLFLP